LFPIPVGFTNPGCVEVEHDSTFEIRHNRVMKSVPGISQPSDSLFHFPSASLPRRIRLEECSSPG